jgi:hypothetical protein
MLVWSGRGSGFESIHMMTINGNAENSKSLASSWTGAVIVVAVGILGACFWYLLNISNQLQDASSKIVTLQQQVHELSVMKDSEIKDEGLINQNTRDIDDIKRRLDSRGK